MSTEAIRKKLAEYLKVADDKKIRALYIMVEDEINTQANDWDEAYTKDLENRSKSFTKGTAKTYTWEETKKIAIERARANKK